MAASPQDIGTTRDYFENHKRARAFPWSLYHAPLENDLQRFLQSVAAAHPNGEVLIIGCGLLHELDRAPEGLRFAVADIDPRAVDAVVARGDSRITAGYVVAPEQAIDNALALRESRFAAVYAKEVVEHVLAWPIWLAGIYRALVPGGQLWISTPNYGEPWLPALESTVLEAIARRDGFSRREIHPTRFSRATLARGLRQTGFADVQVRVPLPRFALTAWAKRPG